jgi:hypothetical protein
VRAAGWVWRLQEAEERKKRDGSTGYLADLSIGIGVDDVHSGSGHRVLLVPPEGSQPFSLGPRLAAIPESPIFGLGPSSR